MRKRFCTLFTVRVPSNLWKSPLKQRYGSPIHSRNKLCKNTRKISDQSATSHSPNRTKEEENKFANAKWRSCVEFHILLLCVCESTVRFDWQEANEKKNFFSLSTPLDALELQGGRVCLSYSLHAIFTLIQFFVHNRRGANEIFFRFQTQQNEQHAEQIRRLFAARRGYQSLHSLIV